MFLNRPGSTVITFPTFVKISPDTCVNKVEFSNRILNEVLIIRMSLNS